MLSNIFARADLGGLARANAKDSEIQSVNNKLIEDYEAMGWVVLKKGKETARLSKPKAQSKHFEDRLWTLFYKMGLQYLSGSGGASLLLQDSTDSKVHNQLDVVAIDDEIAMAFECKTAEKYSKRPQFQQELAKFSTLRERFIRSVNKADQPWGSGAKRTPLLAFFMENIQLSDNDKERAKDANVLLFDEGDLAYYEKLVSHLGPAARYQFYADAAPGKTISGLSIKVPAVKTRMGGNNCYAFPVSPEYLLKIAYVSHRAKGKASDIHAYQRMISKSRLSKIREYISEKGVFPTNIVLNIEKKYLSFQKVKQENTDDDQDASGILGWLEIRPAYKSAWVIDGQHRLFAYSGHPRAKTSHLSVLAFEGLSPSMQAGLFVDINAKQKSVKQSLLQELHAELHWESDHPLTRMRAIVSKAIQVLDSDKDSPLKGRVLTADVKKDPLRCISFAALHRAIAKPKLFVLKESKGEVLQYGPYWGGDNLATLKRVVKINEAWLKGIQESVQDWWALGSDEGGGLTMNDGITSCLNVLDSVIEYVEKDSKPLILRDTDDVVEIIRPFAIMVGEYLATLSTEKRKNFRDLRGVQGQTVRARQIQLAIRGRVPAFDPAGLDEFFEQQSEQTNGKAKIAIDRIEKMLQAIVVQELKQNFKSLEDSWWIDGVPKSVRLSVITKSEQDDNKRGSREAYFDFMDYRKIAMEQWPVFQSILGYGTKKNDSKDKQTKWMVEVNEWRNIVAHASSGKTVSLEGLASLQEYESWLQNKSDGKEDDDKNVAEEEAIE